MDTNKKMASQARIEQRIDHSIKETFPASDSPAAGHPTATEPIEARQDRKPPAITKEQIEHAKRGDEHAQNDSIKRPKTT